MRLWYALLALLTACAVPLAAQAEGFTDLDELLGKWTFSTGEYRGGACQMSGFMSVYPSEKTNALRCELTAIEKCSFGHSTVLQACTLHKSGDRVSITSTVVEIIESKPNSLGYLPDNFVLTVASPSRMFGALISAVTASAVFLRAEGTIS